MIVKGLTERHLEFLSLTEGCQGSSKSTLVRISNCWKAHAAAHIIARADQEKMCLWEYVILLKHLMGRVS